MKKKLHMILSMIFTAMLCMALCFAFAGCSKAPVQLQNELGALLEGGGFEKGSSLVTDLIETTGEKGQEIISLLEGQNYDKNGEISIYDIFVAKDGNEVQPNGKVKITLPAPFESESGYITFHIRSNNIVEALKTVYEDGNISFETDSFSTFVVTPKDPEATAAKSTLKILRSGDGGNLNVRVNGEERSTASLAYENRIECDMYSTIMLSAYIFTPDTHDFIGWYRNYESEETFITAAWDYSFEMAEEEVTIIGVIREKSQPSYCSVSVSMEGSGGSVNCGSYHISNLGSGYRTNVARGEIMILSAFPSSGVEFDGWYVNGERVSTDISYYLRVEENDVNVVAKFNDLRKTLKISQTGQGSTSVMKVNYDPHQMTSGPDSTASVKYTEGSIIKLTATRDPNESNCSFIGWYLVKGDDQVLLSEEKEFEITLTEDTSIIAVFKNIYQFEANTSDSSLGKISLDGDDDIGLLLRAIPEGGSITLKAVPKNGGIFEGWYLVKGQSEELISKDAEYTFSNIREGMKVIARFRKSAVYSLTVTTNDANLGCIKNSESGAVSKYTADLTEGETLTLKAVANEGCTFDGWYLVKSNGSLELISKNAEYTFVMGSSNTEIKAIFTESSATLRVTQRGNGGGTTISFNGGDYSCTNTDGHVSSSSFKVGTQITLTANVRSSDSYEFVGWYSINGTAETLITADESYTFTLNGDESILAVFREKVVTPTTYTFSAFVSGDGGDIWHNGSVCEDKAYTAVLPAGSTVTLKAVAAEGYTFEGWYVDNVVAIGALISTDATYTFTVGSEDMRVVARFAGIPTYTFRAVVGSEGGMIHHNGVEQPNGYYAEHTAGDTVTLTAVPADGYSFVCWIYSDDNREYEITDATYTFTVNSEMYVSAMFEKKVVALRLDVANAGFAPTGVTTVEIGSTYHPNPEGVVVYKVYSDGEDSWLAPENYTVDLGGLDFSKVGTYTITYTYNEDTTVKATITVSVVASTQS